MSKNYCGKSCERCSLREELACSGCRDMEGKSLHVNDCEIARCCVAKNHDGCSACADQEKCYRLLCSEDMPEDRKQHIADKAESESWMAENAPDIGRLLGHVFLCLITGLALTVLNVRFLTDKFPAVGTFARTGSTVIQILTAILFLRLSKFQNLFRTAGWCSLVITLGNLITQLISNMALSLLYIFASLILGLVGTWYEYHGYAELLTGLDDELSKKWHKLFKWWISLPLASVGCLILMYILNWFGAVVLVVDVIAIFVVQVLYYVYVYRTTRHFKTSLSSSHKMRDSSR